MKPIHLRLKHFTGIKHGLGLDEVSVDLAQVSGLVALVGPNGAGKTTFLDNLHPYRLMPSKCRGVYSPGACDLYNEVYGVGEKELVFVMGGRKYKSLLYIDTARKRQEAYLYVEDSGAANGWRLLNTGGRVSTYDDAVEQIVGAPKLYFAAMFRCQDAPRLNTYRNSTIKDILAELLALDDIQERGKTAKAVVDHLDLAIARANGRANDMAARASMLDSTMKTLEGVQHELQLAEQAQTAAAAEVERLSLDAAAITAEIAKLTAYESTAHDKKRQLNVIADRQKAACRRLEEISERHHKQYTDFLQKVNRLSKIKSNGETIRAKAQEEAQLTATRADLAARLAAIATKLNSAKQANHEMEALKRERSALELQQIKLAAERTAAIRSLKDEIARIEQARSLLMSLPCSDSVRADCPVVRNSVADVARLPQLAASLAQAETENNTELADRIAALTERINGLAAAADTRTIDKEQAEVLSAMKTIDAQLADIKRFTRLLPELESAEALLLSTTTEWQSRLQDHVSECDRLLTDIEPMEAEIAILTAEISDLTSRVNQLSQLKTQQADITARLTNAKKRLQDAQATVAAYTRQVAAAARDVETAQEAQKNLQTITTYIGRLQEERTVWALLQRAFSNDGIIALEIDDAGPHIAANANALLAACYGSRFTVRIDTQRLKADGASAESFDILVYDSESGESASLRDKSGGEKTWIEDAVTKALALINADRSGKQYSALMTDERDGALAHDVKRSFFKLKREVLKLGGFESEYFVSHTPTAHELADTRLVFTPRVGIVIDKR